MTRSTSAPGPSPVPERFRSTSAPTMPVQGSSRDTGEAHGGSIWCLSRNVPCSCSQTADHAGPHTCTNPECEDWPNERTAGPCPSLGEAVLGLPEPVQVRCGLLAGHQGRHVHHMEWAAPDPFLVEQIEHRRQDKAFQERLATRMREDKPILDALAASPVGPPATPAPSSAARTCDHVNSRYEAGQRFCLDCGDTALVVTVEEAKVLTAAADRDAAAERAAAVGRIRAWFVRYDADKGQDDNIGGTGYPLFASDLRLLLGGE